MSHVPEVFSNDSFQCLYRSASRFISSAVNLSRRKLKLFIIFASILLVETMSDINGRYNSAILLIGAVTDFPGLPEAGLPSTVNLGFFGFTGYVSSTLS